MTEKELYGQVEVTTNSYGHSIVDMNKRSNSTLKIGDMELNFTTRNGKFTMTSDSLNRSKKGSGIVIKPIASNMVVIDLEDWEK